MFKANVTLKLLSKWSEVGPAWAKVSLTDASIDEQGQDTSLEPVALDLEPRWLKTTTNLEPNDFRLGDKMASRSAKTLNH